VALAREPAPAGNARATLLAHHSHLRWHDLSLKRRCELLRLREPKPKFRYASLLIALDAGTSVSVITPGRSSATSLTRHTSFGTRPTLFL
jgi:hypothetical protein